MRVKLTSVSIMIAVFLKTIMQLNQTHRQKSTYLYGKTNKEKITCKKENYLHPKQSL